MRPVLPFILVIAALGMLACGLTATGPDVAATVEAAYATLTAERQTPTAPPVDTAATATLQATSETTTPTLSPTPPQARSENGPTLQIARCPNEIVLDGDSEDWGTLPTFAVDEAVAGEVEWRGTADASGQAALCWTGEALYLLVEVTDDSHVQTREGSSQWQGDEVELTFDGDLFEDFYEEEWNADERQIGLSPGDFLELEPNPVVFYPEIDENPAIDLNAARPIAAGGDYTLEARIPWGILGGQGAAGARFGLCVGISDNDQPGQASQDTLVSSCADFFLPDPTTYLTVELVN